MTNACVPTAFANAEAQSEQIAETIVTVRRQWDHWMKARYRLSDVSRLHWDDMSGGINAAAPQLFVHGYVLCNGMIDGELAHSCRHGRPPHEIKVCITKKFNESVWHEVIKLVGPKPKKSRPMKA